MNWELCWLYDVLCWWTGSEEEPRIEQIRLQGWVNGAPKRDSAGSLDASLLVLTGVPSSRDSYNMPTDVPVDDMAPGDCL